MGLFPGVDPLDRYASNLVAVATRLAEDAVEDAQDRAKVSLAATEICYYLVQMAQRSVDSMLNNAQMADLIPRLVFNVFDAFAATFVPPGVSKDELADYRATWTNTGSDRNDFYSGLSLDRATGGGRFEA